MQVLYATTNPGKLMEVSKYLTPYGVTVVSPADIGVEIEVDESGQTLEENATLKAEAYRDHVPPHTIIMSDDTGVEIDALNGEPGIHVRRWRDRTTAMSDQEIIDYCVERLRGIPSAQRGAQFRTVIAFGIPDGQTECFDGILRGEIMPTPVALKYVGMPFETLFYVSEWQQLLGDIHALSIEEKQQQGYLTHRERAVQKAWPRLHELLQASH